MDTHKFLFLSFFVVFLLFSDVVSSYKINLRIRLSDANNNDSHALQVSPSPSPLPQQLVDNATKTTNTTESNDKSSGADLEQPDSNVSVTDTPTSRRNETEGGDEIGGEDMEKRNSESSKSKEEENISSDGRNCTGVSSRCKDQKSLVACILDYQPGSKEILVLIQNDGDKNLSVDLSGSTLVDNALLEIAKHRSMLMKLHVGNETVILRAGDGSDGQCVLHLPVSEGNFFFNLPSYDQLITPVNGAYFLIVTVIVFGGTCAFCSFRKRRRSDGVAYQELEMSAPETAAVNNEESAQGWDQGWDDDWDEENAVKSPAARRAGSISANGLTSRTANKDGWEKDRDD